MHGYIYIYIYICVRHNRYVYIHIYVLFVFELLVCYIPVCTTYSQAYGAAAYTRKYAKYYHVWGYACTNELNLSVVTYVSTPNCGPQTVALPAEAPKNAAPRFSLAPFLFRVLLRIVIMEFDHD